MSLRSWSNDDKSGEETQSVKPPVGHHLVMSVPQGR
jgi:hypothetical protein